MVKRIIYLSYMPLTQKIERDFYLLALNKAGHDIEYWNLTKLYFGDIAGIEPYLPINKIKVLSIDSYKDLYSLIKRNNEALFVVLMSFEWRLFRLIRCLNKYNCKTLAFGLSPIPVQNVPRKVLRLCKVITFNKLINRIRNSLMKYLVRLQILNFYDYCLVSGNLGWTGMGYVDKSCFSNTIFLDFNSTDYDEYQNFVTDESESNKPYIVFIDEYYPFHPDASMLKLTTISHEVYYQQMNHTFELIEQKYNMPIVIAAHPKALKYKEYNYYNGRKVIFGKTLSLINGCNFAIAHDSTAIDYAIFCKKPMLFLTSQEIKQAMLSSYRTIEFLASLFYSPLVSMNDITASSLPETLKLSKEQQLYFDDFVINYHTTLRNGKSNEKLIVEYVNEIFP